MKGMGCSIREEKEKDIETERRRESRVRWNTKEIQEGKGEKREREREQERPFFHSFYVLRELLCCCYPEFLSISLSRSRRAMGQSRTNGKMDREKEGGGEFEVRGE